jgi:aminotransferase EvaB
MIVPFNDLKRRDTGLRADIHQAVNQVLNSGQYILGSQVQAFEAAFSAYCGAKHAVGVASGTDALELALYALNCGEGDDIITVANAGGYATTAILHAGANPIFADVSPNHFLITAESFLHAITPKTKAVIVTHLYGLMADMPALCAAAAEHGIPIIEDCAQAHGAAWRGQKAGTWGTMGCFSFYPTKNLGAIGDAGMVITNNKTLAERLQSLRQYGWQGVKYRNSHDVGRNSRMDELQAAILLLLLPHLDRWNEKRRNIVERYRAILAPLGLEFQEINNPQHFVAHLCGVLSDNREALKQALSQKGIATDVHYPVADYAQPAIIKRIGQRAALPATEKIISEVFSLPCFPEMTEEEIDHVITAVKYFLTSGKS